MQIKTPLLLLIVVSSCASNKSSSPDIDDLSLIKSGPHDSQTITCFQKTNSTHQSPRIEGEKDYLLKTYDYFDCMDSIQYDEAVKDKNENKKVAFGEVNKLTETAELVLSPESEDLNCELNINAFKQDEEADAKYYNCKKNDAPKN